MQLNSGETKYKKSSVSEGRLNWVWTDQKEYAECYNLAETDEEIKITQRRASGRKRRCDDDGAVAFSISTETHDMLRTLDGYDDSVQ